MTDEKDFAEPIRDHATTNTYHAHPAPARRSWISGLKHRWPTVLAIAFAVLVAFGLGDGSDLYF